MTSGGTDSLDPLIGRTLAGTYRIDARLGAGAMGVVYRAHHTLLDADFAVKVLPPGVAADADGRRRFLVEAHSLAAFTHRNAVQVRHCGEDGGLLFLAMDLVRGETLADVLAREGPLAPARAVALVTDVLAALSEAHDNGIVHRDLKPGNIMVERTRGPSGSEAERVRVLDFGLARIVGAEHAAMPSAYASLGGAVVGTVAYMAPEQLRAEDDVDGRADVFAAGVVLYEALTGVSPFPGASTMSIALRIVDGAPEPWTPDALARVPPALRAVVERALTRDRDHRFPSADAMAQALLRAQRDGLAPSPPPTPTRAPPSTPTSPAEVDTRRRRLLAATGTLIAVAAVVWIVTRDREDGAVPSIEAASARARAAIDRGNWQDAIDASTLVLDARPRDGEMRLLRGEARTALFDRGADDDLDLAAQLRRDDPAVLVAKARWSRQVLRDAKAADQAIRAALTIDARHVPARVERAEALIEAGELDRAEVDVAAIEADASGDATGPWLRARLALAAAGEGRPVTPVERDAHLAIAAEAAARAATIEPKWAEGPSTQSATGYLQATTARARGHYEAAQRLWDDALTTATEAIERITRHPEIRRQGAHESRAYEQRAQLRFARVEPAQAAEDLEAALRRTPREPRLLSLLAYARQQAGEHELAILAFERLYSITADKDPLFSQAFSWQRLGDERADRGEVVAAGVAYDKALEVYGRGIQRFPEALDLLTYRGETYLRRALLHRGAVRTDDLARARTELDRALAGTPGDTETLLRRAEVALADERPEDALLDLDTAIGDRQDHTPRYYARRASARVAVAARSTSLDEDLTRRRTLVAGALRDATRAMELLPTHARGLLPLVASVRVAMAKLAPDDAEREAALTAALADLTRLETEGTGEERHAVRARAIAAHGRAEVLLVRGDAQGAVAAAELAVSLRDAEHAAGRWSLDARLLERLADTYEAAGNLEGARAARERAATLPR